VGVCGSVWGIGLRRRGCGCGRRFVTGSCVIRETTPTGSIYLYIYLSLSIYLVRGLGRAFSIYLSISRRVGA